MTASSPGRRTPEPLGSACCVALLNQPAPRRIVPEWQAQQQADDYTDKAVATSNIDLHGDFRSLSQGIEVVVYTVTSWS